VKAGRELDAKVAEVMGLEPCQVIRELTRRGSVLRPRPRGHPDYEWWAYCEPAEFINWVRDGEGKERMARPLPEFSTSIAAAWPLVEKYKLTVLPIEGDDDKIVGWFAGRFDQEHDYLDDEGGVIDGHFKHDTYARAETAEVAICLAALETEKRNERERREQCPS
jgi:hypothetical protein